MAHSTATAPELTQAQVRTILTSPLETASTFLASGPTVIDTPGPLRMPFAPVGAPLESDSEANPPVVGMGFTGENELIPEMDHEFDELQLLPSTMKSIKVLTRFSNELARQTFVSLDAALQARLVADVAAKVDAQLYSAAGDGVTTPRGMFAWTGTQEVPVGGALGLDDILDGQTLALSANVDPSRLRLFLRPGDYMALRALKDNDDRYMLQPDAAQGATPTVLGLPVTVSPRIPEGRAALVDMAQVVVARDVAPSVKLLDQTFGQYDQQAIRVVTRFDAAPTQPDAVVTFSGITAPSNGGNGGGGTE